MQFMKYGWGIRMKAIDFLTILEKEGFDFFTGVPCSYLSPLCKALARKDQSFQVPAVREDIALGLAAGAYLAGKLPMIRCSSQPWSSGPR